MPAIKKRITAEYLEREQQRSEQNGRAAADADEDTAPAVPPTQSTSPLKRKAPGNAMLKGLDGEVLVEKRKRTLPPAEQKLDVWLDGNLEKKAESTLSLVKLYQFYTDMCQQDASYVVEMDVFKTMLHNKFGKEFGLTESSAYSGLLKESKPRKKPVVAPSLGYKMKDLIQEALKASGNPTKGMMFAWVKKFIAAKYPALQIELRPHFLRKALDREIYAGKVELVKGIGFCGFYRLPGPPDVEEETTKSKKKVGKKTVKGEEGAESADDTKAETDGEDSDKSSGEKVDSTADRSEDKKNKDVEDVSAETEESQQGKEGEGKKEEKKAKKKRKRTHKPRPRNVARHGNPQSINDVFPLAMTYMAEPKEASYGRIKKYLEKYYGKVDIDAKLKKCLEHGCDTGMWDRVSGSGASGSFQLQVDSFNPEHTESLTDMVCSAIIASTEPKTSSVRLLKSYISEYHAEFNIDRRPIKLRNALERAVKQNQLRRISGIGMSGSFQLVEQFIPSPAILAGEEDEEESDYEEATGKDEVYVIRKTKSGRRAPVEKTQIDFSSTYKKKGPGSGVGKKGGQRKAASKKTVYQNSSSEEEESESDPDADYDDADAGYRPRPTKSRGGGKGSVARKPPAKAAPAKTRSPANKAKGRGSTSPSKPQTPARKGRAAFKSLPKKRPTAVREPSSEEEEEKVAKYVPRASLSRRGGSGTPAKTSAARRGGPLRVVEPQAEEEEDEEDYYEVEEEYSTPVKQNRVGKSPGSKGRTPQTPPSQTGRKKTVQSPTPSKGRTPRSASTSARKSLREMESGEEESEDEYLPRPTSSRAGRKR